MSRPATASVFLLIALALPTDGHQPAKKGKPAAPPTAKELLKDQQVKKAFDRVNELRKVAGLEAVELDPDLSEGCRKHAAYLIANRGSPETAGLKAHEEKAELKGSTAEGAKAGKASVIHFVAPSAAVDGWIASFYHRVPMLQPGLKKVGIGYATGGGEVVVLVDVVSGVDFAVKWEGPVVYPADGQKGVPTAMGPEIPDPKPKGAVGPGGFPVTASYPLGATVTRANLTLTTKGAGGKPVTIPGYLSTPEKPATDFTQWNSVCLIPQAPLSGGTTYTAELTAEVEGKAVKKSWQFTTGR